MGNVGHVTLRKLAACLLMDDRNYFFNLSPMYSYKLILVLFHLWLMHLALENASGPKIIYIIKVICNNVHVLYRCRDSIAHTS